MPTPAPAPVKLTYRADVVRLVGNMLAFLITMGVVWRILWPHFPLSLGTALGALAFAAACALVFVLAQRILLTLGYALLHRVVVIDERGVTSAGALLPWSDITGVRTGPLNGQVSFVQTSPVPSHLASSFVVSEAFDAVAPLASDDWIIVFAARTGNEMHLQGPGFRDGEAAQRALREHLRSRLGLELPEHFSRPSLQRIPPEK